MIKYSLFLAVVAGATFAVSGCGSKPTYPQTMAHPLLNKPLPELRARETLDGKSLQGNEGTGRAVVVKFFAEYCEPCKRTLPATEGLHRKMEDVAFVGVDEDESGSTARELVSRYSLTFPVVHDASRSFQGRFRVRELPVTFVADKEGVVRWVGGPDQTEDDLRRAIEAAR